MDILEMDNLDALLEAALLEPFTYISANPGKGIRRLIVEAFNR